MSEFTKRILSGLVLAPLTVFAVYVGGPWLALYLSLAAGVMAWEFYRMARAGGSHPLAFIGIPAAALVPLAAHAHTLGILPVPVSAIVVAALAVLAFAMFLRPVEQKPLTAAAITVFGVFYTGAAITFGYAIRYFPYVADAAAGTALVIFPVWLTWSTDTGAYLVGRIVGGPKLAASISPRKTISGAIGGVATAGVMAWAYGTYVLRPLAQLTLPPAGLAVFAACISVAAMLGDLAESYLKREAGVKDASGLIPGHGGVLDRLDSILFALPIAYMLLPALLKPAPVVP
ncbi:MAG: phosphatidate cytidylyltransferase [Gemmatimonadota bacterium]